MQYTIAGLTVSYKAEYPMLKQRSRKYVSDVIVPDAPDLSVGEAENLELRKTAPNLSVEECEYVLAGRNFYEYMIDNGGMMLHSSAVVVDNEAYLFSAPSGTGKSTHTDLWLKKFGDRAYILNDDKPAIRIHDGVAYAYGTPFSGKHDLSRDVEVPIRGIAFIERATENSIERMTDQKATFSLLNQSLRPYGQKRFLVLLQTLDKLIKSVPVYTLHCNMDIQAAEVSYCCMKKGNEE